MPKVALVSIPLMFIAMGLPLCAVRVMGTCLDPKYSVFVFLLTVAK